MNRLKKFSYGNVSEILSDNHLKLVMGGGYGLLPGCSVIFFCTPRGHSCGTQGMYCGGSGDSCDSVFFSVCERGCGGTCIG